MVKNIWLVVDLPPWKIWKSDWMIIPNNYMESHKSHVPNHQPVLVCVNGYDTYPSKIWVCQLGWWHSQLNGKFKNVPNHHFLTFYCAHRHVKRCPTCVGLPRGNCDGVQTRDVCSVWQSVDGFRLALEGMGHTHAYIQLSIAFSLQSGHGTANKPVCMQTIWDWGSPTAYSTCCPQCRRHSLRIFINHRVRRRKVNPLRARCGTSAPFFQPLSFTGPGFPVDPIKFAYSCKCDTQVMGASLCSKPPTMVQSGSSFSASPSAVSPVVFQRGPLASWDCSPALLSPPHRRCLGRNVKVRRKSARKRGWTPMNLWRYVNFWYEFLIWISAACKRYMIFFTYHYIPSQ